MLAVGLPTGLPSIVSARSDKHTDGPARLCVVVDRAGMETLDLYGHLLSGLDQAAAEGLDRLMRTAAAAPVRPSAVIPFLDVELHRAKTQST